MNYFSSMAALLKMDGAVIADKISIKSMQFYCILNVTILGLIYGISASFFIDGVLAGQGIEASGEYSTFKIVFAGVPVAFLMHAGAALFIWVFLRGIGGNANFLVSYFYIGIAAVAMWPLAPVVAALQLHMDKADLFFIKGVGLLFSIYGFAVLYPVIRNIYNLGHLKMAIAASVTFIYIGCFLYLWL
ncbi:membrane hypothetical protein [Desulfamplus magnetovallimortis]|uniref:Yip1 domain-containing protein n=1 Tax=Desulfamplus magnetovallimortis TaxID=1246637 RepID=A0A1W1HHY1_9BACT|nr:hypothetical protein [Desulfamplus magnetovallimortis]SLM32084.1 membrane hypothetical protein [Desulfamplus magnetovallimortis]